MARNLYYLSILIFLIHPIVYAQDLTYSNPDFEVCTINMQFDKIGNYSFACIFKQGTEDVYLPLEELFDLLKIRKSTSADGLIISGFLEGNTKPYRIDLISKVLTYSELEYKLTESDFVLDMGILLLNLKLFNSVFGFNVAFNYRNLTATFKVNFEPLVVRFERLERTRNFLQKDTSNIKAETTLVRQYHWFKAGMLDWAFTGIQHANGLGENRFNLGFGAEVIGGQTDVFLNYSDKYVFNINQQRYQWRWVDNHANYVRQIHLGRIYNQSISSILYPIDGFMVTNTPSTLRKALGEYMITDHTQPDWIVELYINKVLVDYTTANASGMYSFKVPLVYGTSIITLRFYGPNGEEQSEEKVIHTPYNLLPKTELEYSVAGGCLLDLHFSRYMLGKINYGVTRWLTIGAGMEYLSSITNNSPFIPFANVSLQLFPKLIMTTEYAHHIRTKATLNYTMPHNVTLDFNYTHYTPGQTAIIYNYLEEKNANLSFPYRLKDLNGYAKFTFRQHLYPNFGFNSGEAVFASNYQNFNLNIGNYFNWTSIGSLNVFSHVGLGWRINTNFNARINTQYNYTKKMLSSCKLELERKVFDNGYMALAYENNMFNNFQSIHLSFRYELAFMSTYLSSNFTNHTTQFSESVRGSFAFADDNQHVYADKQNAVGRSGIVVIPYVDINHNDVFDDGEPLADKLSVQCDGGHVVANSRDTIIRIVGLAPFVDYHLTMSELGFENLSWQMSCKNLDVTTDPNQFKRVELSIKPMGEVTGKTVNQLTNPLGRILLHVKNDRSETIKEMMTESDGYFSFLGLKPGSYTLEVDAHQLERIQYSAKPVSFVIKYTIDGDIVDVGDIILKSITDTVGYGAQRLQLD